MNYVNIVKKLIENKITISTAESITGGLIAKMITDVPGSSAIMNESYVTYSNESKTKILGVKNEIIDKYGVVSSEVAKAMAEGLYNITKSNICISTTGNAGPTVCDDKPVGRVYIGIHMEGMSRVIECNIDTNYDGTEESNFYNRNLVREEIAKKVFEEIRGNL